ncbi:zinc finger MYM-type protein 1-like, partial [Aphis craccivora]
LFLDKSLYSHVYSLLEVVLAVHVNSATYKHLFSAIQTNRTWIRTSMHQDRFFKSFFNTIYRKKDFQ